MAQPPWSFSLVSLHPLPRLGHEWYHTYSEYKTDVSIFVGSPFWWVSRLTTRAHGTRVYVLGPQNLQPSSRATWLAQYHTISLYSTVCSRGNDNSQPHLAVFQWWCVLESKIKLILVLAMECLVIDYHFRINWKREWQAWYVNAWKTKDKRFDIIAAKRVQNSCFLPQ